VALWKKASKMVSKGSSECCEGSRWADRVCDVKDLRLQFQGVNKQGEKYDRDLVMTYVLQ